MKKVTLILLSFFLILFTASAQNGIDFHKSYPGGGKLLYFVDSLATDIYYWNIYPNQPNTSFNYLPEVNNLNIQINFRKANAIQDYRYTILVDEKPFVVNKPINKAQLIDTHAGGDEEIFSSATLGVFTIKDKIVTVLVYSVESPLNMYKSVFYGKPIPKAKVQYISKDFGKTVGLKNLKFSFGSNDSDLSVVKNRSDIDYIYNLLIKDKQTNKIIFKSTSWEYGNYVEEGSFLPYIKITKNVFKKSGNYEIIIQPFIRGTSALKNVEKYAARYTLSINLEEEKFSKKEVWTYIGYTCGLLGLISGLIMVFIKRRNKTKFSIEQKQKEIAQLKLNAVRSQLNPHFLFNALAGIQNLMNKNETDNANRYLSKFARLTRNVLDNRDLISLTEEKTLLDDYLQMEQLRFGFQYKLMASSDLDTENVEIPAMLLQPFVENAVKHGVAEKAEDGKIEISFRKDAADLVLQITDNGKGFDISKTYNGLGLTLSKNRITLLNTIYKETPFQLNIHSDLKGTTVKITLTQWL
ncbi:sensor histidine kinase [Pedobacter aquatilis]|uniref:sensor histidine kinase n=1 Tax=Pedobacter aquatilis TaxID=351343 RepID=UPI00292F10E6|nr:histidine kinase [Pedobacter aquatilis]